MKYQSSVICHVLGPGESNKKVKDAFDALHQTITAEAGRKSERGFPRISTSFGVVDGTKISAKECVGNMFLVLCLGHTIEGWGLLKPYFWKHKIRISRFRQCLKLQLGFDKWVHEDNPLT